MSGHFLHSALDDENHKFSDHIDLLSKDWLMFLSEIKNLPDRDLLLQNKLKVPGFSSPHKVKVLLKRDDLNSEILDVLIEFGSMDIDVARFIRDKRYTRISVDYTSSFNVIVTVEEFGSCEIASIIDVYNEMHCSEEAKKWLPKARDNPGKYGYHKRTFAYPSCMTNDRPLGEYIKKAIDTKCGHPNENFKELIKHKIYWYGNSKQDFSDFFNEIGR